LTEKKSPEAFFDVSIPQMVRFQKGCSFSSSHDEGGAVHSETRFFNSLVRGSGESEERSHLVARVTVLAELFGES
jgi:hypothetical protein